MRKSFIDTNKEQLIELLADNSMTYEQIASRFGVSRQRIHQASIELGVHRPSSARRRLSTVENHKKKFTPRFQDLIRKLESMDFYVSFVPLAQLLSTRLILVDGKKCTFCITKEGDNRLYIPTIRKFYDFLLVYMEKTKEYLVLPKDVVPQNVDVVTINLHFALSGWKPYVEAWHLLKKEKV